MFTPSTGRRIRRFHVVVAQWTSKKCSKNDDARAELLFWSWNQSFWRCHCRRRGCLSSLWISHNWPVTYNKRCQDTAVGLAATVCFSVCDDHEHVWFISTVSSRGAKESRVGHLKGNVSSSSAAGVSNSVQETNPILVTYSKRMAPI